MEEHPMDVDQNAPEYAPTMFPSSEPLQHPLSPVELSELNAAMKQLSTRKKWAWFAREADTEEADE